MKAKLRRYLIVFFVGVISILFILYGSYNMNGRKIAAKYNIPHPAVIGHRGAAYWAPESTLASFKLAVAIMPNYIEFDVQRSKDGILFVFHDDTLARTTNVSEIYPNRVNDPVGSFTWKELQQLDSGSWFNKKFPERARTSFEKLPILSFAEVLDIFNTADSKIGIYLETKSPELYIGIEEQIINLLKEKNIISPEGTLYNRNIILESFDANSVQRFQELVPQIPRSYLFNAKMLKSYGKEHLLQKAKEIGNGIGPNGSLVYPWLIHSAHKQNLILHTYTINQLWQMRSLLWLGVDGFFTDRPDLGRKICHKLDISVDELWEKIGF